MHKKICTAVFPDRRFLHRKFSAQKSYAQKVLHTTSFTYRCFYTQMSLHRHKLHTDTCAHLLYLHTANFYTERLWIPFLITYLSCSPSQVFILGKNAFQISIDIETLWNHCETTTVWFIIVYNISMVYNPPLKMLKPLCFGICSRSACAPWGDVKAWMERWFVRFFRHCKLDSPLAAAWPVPHPFHVEFITVYSTSIWMPSATKSWGMPPGCPC